MAGKELDVRLEGGGPWGFRLQGGKDFGTPLTIAKVTPGGKAERAGVAVGDLILSINGQPCDVISHFSAQDAVKRSGQILDLTVSRGNGREKKVLTVTDTVHSAGVDHKYNAKAKPFGAPSGQATTPKPYMASYAAPARTAPPGGGGGAPPPPPPPPSAFQQQGLQLSRPAKDPDDYRDSEVLKALHKEDEALAGRFKLAISDNGDVAFEGEQPSWHHAPPNPNVQSKTFKMLQKHLQHDDDDLPPPPPEAYREDEDEHRPVKSRSMKVLEDQIDWGEAPASVFSRQPENRSKPSSTPAPQFYRPSPPKIKTASQPLVPSAPAPVFARPGQPAPVALPGMVAMQAAQPQSSRQPQVQTSRPSAPQVRPSGGTSYSAAPPPAPTPPPAAPSYGGGVETKREPIKPASPTGPREGPRTPYCESCQQEIFGPFVSAIGRSWHPEHFVCAGCGDSLQNQGFIEEGGKLYCEKDYNQFFAPHCDTCKQPIVGPKSLHACPKPVAAPASDILRAIRESARTGVTPEEIIAKHKHREPHVNAALTLNKRTTLPRTRNDSSVSFGINYNVRKAPTVDRNSNIVSSWSNGVTGPSHYPLLHQSHHPSVVTRPSHHPVSVTQQSQQPVAVNARPRSDSSSSTSSACSYRTHSDVDSGSLREKVIQLKQELKHCNERQEEDQQKKLEANKRCQEAKRIFSERHKKLAAANEKLERVLDKLDKAEHRLLYLERRKSENIQEKEKLEKEQLGEEREIKNVQYEITEAKSAKELTLQRLREVSQRVSARQLALQRAEGQMRARSKRAKALEDVIGSFRMKIRNLHVNKAKKLAKSEDQTHRLHLLEHSIEYNEERSRVAEGRLLPLKIYTNQLQDAVEERRESLSKAQRQLASYTQRLRHYRRYYY